QGPDLERTMLLLCASGVKHTALRSLAVAFDENWDLVEERVPATAPEPPSVLDLVGDVLAAMDDVCGERANCVDGNDLLCRRLDEIADYADRLQAIDNEVDLMEALSPSAPRKPPSFKVGSIGKTPLWRIDRDELRKRVRAAGDK